MLCARRTLAVALLCGGLCGGFGRASGQEIGAEGLRKGWDQLRAWGLPGVKGGRYVRLESGFPWMREVPGLELTGNAWLISETNGLAELVRDGTRRVEVLSYEAVQERMAAAMERAGAEGVAMEDSLLDRAGRWSDANVERDIEALQRFLEKMKDAEREGAMDAGLGGYALLFAAQLDERGRHEEAAGLGTAAIEAFGAADVVEQALNWVAGAKYEEALERFRATGDFGQLHQELKRLEERFGSAWHWKPAIDRVIASLALRGAGGEPPPLEGPGLTEDDRALASRLAEGGPGMGRAVAAAGFWLLPEEKEPGEWSGSSKDPVIEAIRARGIQALPMLVALLEDPWPVRAVTGERGDMVAPLFRGDLTSTWFWEGFPRPMTRGDVARDMLEAVVSDSNDGEENEGSLRAGAERMFERFRAASTSDLARAMMEEPGWESDRERAVSYLVASGSEADREAAEGAMLRAEDPWDYYQAAVQLTIEEKLSEGFVNAFDDVLEQRIEPSGAAWDDSEDYIHRMVTARKTQLAEFRQLSGGATLAELMEQVAAGERVDGRVMWRRLGRMEKGAATGTVLKAAAAQKDPEARRRVVGYLSFGIPEPRAAGATNEVPASTREDWIELLKDERQAGDGAGPTSVAAAAARMAFLLYGGEGAMERLAAAESLGAPGVETIVAWAQAKVNGEALPELPAADQVDEAERASLRNELGGLASDAVAGWMEALAPSERLALREMAGTETNVALALQTASGTIRTVDTVGVPASGTNVWAAWKGRELGLDWFDAAMGWVGPLARSGTNAWVVAFRRVGEPGVTVSAGLGKMGDATAGWMPRAGPRVTAHVSGERIMDEGATGAGTSAKRGGSRLLGGGGSAMASWELAEAEATEEYIDDLGLPLPRSLGAQGATMQDGVTNALRSIEQGAFNPAAELAVWVIGAAGTSESDATSGSKGAQDRGEATSGEEATAAGAPERKADEEL